ncbi:MAG TPA: Ig domain-containing protein [Acidimicrobiales bacterium]|nr:Ig domain-containing protein [Acidimicrobiales bacterium]
MALVSGELLFASRIGAQSSSVSFSPSKAAPGTRVIATSMSTPLTCVNNVTFTQAGVSASAAIVSQQGTSLTFTVPNLAPGFANVTLTGSSPPACDFAGSFQLAPPLAITTSALSDGGVGIGYYFRIRASGGVGPYTWLISAGGLPTGLTLNTNGIITGTPVAPGQFLLAVEVTDNNGLSASKSFTFTVEPPPTVTVATLPIATVGESYSVTLTAAGGVPPYSWSVGPRGGLPGGLVVNSDGTLSGSPGTPGTSMLDLQVTDSAGVSGDAIVPLTVEPIPEMLAIAQKDGAVTVARPPSTASTLKVRRPTGGVVAIAASSNGKGFWVLTRSGAVRGLDGAQSLGSVGRKRHAGRPVAIAADPAGEGYWVLTSNGRVAAFGAARIHHPQGGRVKLEAAVGIAPSPTGGGYWVLSAHGVVEAFGDAPTLGSVDQPHREFTAIALMTGAPGYWVLAANGRVFPFGSAWREPLTGGVRLHGRMVGIASTPDGAGYWIVSSTGAVGAFGTARLSTAEPDPVAGSALVSITAGS